MSTGIGAYLLPGHTHFDFFGTANYIVSASS
jgi:hypothetical protein